MRENTEGLYSGLEHEVVPGVVESLKIITEKASTRIAKFAFEYARKNQRKKIHCIHKANIMKLSDGLFLRCARNVAKDYPEITYGEHIVDNTCMQLVMNPYQYDMLVMENLYGDILSDLCAAFVGGLGFVPSANLGDECAMFEAVHGSAPDIAGKNLANPTALLRSALLMVRHLGEHAASTQIRNALERVYRHPEKLTRDIGGKAGTSEFADAVIEEMQSNKAEQRQSSFRAVDHVYLSAALQRLPILPACAASPIPTGATGFYPREPCRLSGSARNSSSPCRRSESAESCRRTSGKEARSGRGLPCLCETR